jgi:predicted lipoprotein with Yx(FWY)xxD motif
VIRYQRLLRAPLAGAFIAAGLTLGACQSNSPAVSDLHARPTTTSGFTLTSASSPVGRILVSANGSTLYDFVPDTPTSSTCTSVSCVFLWPPLIADGPVTVAPGLDPQLVGTIRRPDGSTQITYGGHPLYTYNSDVTAGMVTGQALLQSGGYWYVVGTNGQQITTPFSVTK